MNRDRIETCTQEGMTASQPGWSVGLRHTLGTSVYTLSVFRPYNHLPNKIGGRGVHKYGDAHGKDFSTEQAAWEFAISRGYLRPWFKSPEVRACNVKHGKERYEQRMSAKAWLAAQREKPVWTLP